MKRIINLVILLFASLSAFAQSSKEIYPFAQLSVRTKYDTITPILLISSGRIKVIDRDTMYVLIPDTTLSYTLRHHSRYDGIIDDGIRFVPSGKLKDRKYIFYYDSSETEPKCIFSIKNHLYSGLWKEFYPEGNIEKSNYYVNGKSNGLFIVYWPNGIVSQITEYCNGIRCGLDIVTFENSTLAELGYYRNDSVEDIIETGGLGLDDSHMTLYKNDIKVIKKKQK